MSWKEAFELYFEEQMLNGLFKDLAYYGIKPPRHVQWAIDEKEILSHQVYWILYQFSARGRLHDDDPERGRPGLARGGRTRRPGRSTRPRVGQGPAGAWTPAAATSTPACRSCASLPDPDGLHRARRPDDDCQRQSVYEGERYDFCSDGCQWIFDREPEKYCQSWLPVHQIYQGNCGGPTAFRTSRPGTASSPATAASTSARRDHQNWLAWHGQAVEGGLTDGCRGDLRLRLAVPVRRGALRRRPARARLVEGQPVLRVRRRRFRFPKAMPFGALVGSVQGLLRGDPDFVPDDAWTPRSGRSTRSP